VAFCFVEVANPSSPAENQKRMAFTSITRLRIRSWRFMPQFFWYALRSSRQAQRSVGFLGGALINDKHRTFWTITVWESEAAMKAYRGADAHRVVMTKLASWCDEASVAHITDAMSRVPDAAEAHRIMQEHGRPSRVNHPSPRHAVLSMEAPSRPALPLKPAQRSERAAA
jgi:antibiotic biosynthesis monooxygenase